MQVSSQVMGFASRGLAAKSGSAEASETVKLPPQFGIPGRYAAALYMTSFKAKALDKVGQEVNEMTKLLRESTELQQFVNEPGLPVKQRAAGMHAVLSKMGASDVTKRFMDVVIENKRTPELLKILEKFSDIVAEQKGHVKATVTTAAPLNKSDLDNVKSGLKKILKSGQTLMLEQKVDPSIISGIIIDVGDKHVDLSVQTRMKKLQQIMTNM